MQRLKREKPYKAEEPFITINKIRKILEKVNIFTTELNLNSEPLYSSRVYIEGLENVGSLGIGCIAKFRLVTGKNPEFCK